MKKSTKTADVKPVGESKLDVKAHTDLFSRAMKSFNTGEYRKARPLFEQAAQGPAIAIKETALMYMRMCDQRSAQEKLVLESAEDYYNYGVGLTNDRRPGEAKSYLEKAVALDPAPHILYAHALASGLSGDMESAAASLRKAVEKDSSIRGLARSDSDFHPLLQNAGIREVLIPERPESA
jgi:tetratricopeptide (TPR) repeat protein